VAAAGIRCFGPFCFVVLLFDIYLGGSFASVAEEVTQGRFSVYVTTVWSKIPFALQAFPFLLFCSGGISSPVLGDYQRAFCVARLLSMSEVLVDLESVRIGRRR